MYLDSAKKKEIFEKHGQSATDTGSVESQVALFTYRIAHLTEHLKSNRKDLRCSLVRVVACSTMWQRKISNAIVNSLQNWVSVVNRDSILLLSKRCS